LRTSNIYFKIKSSRCTEY